MVLALLPALLGLPSSTANSAVAAKSTRIAFERSVRSGPSEIFVMNADGTQQRRTVAVSIGRQTALRLRISHPMGSTSSMLTEAIEDVCPIVRGHLTTCGTSASVDLSAAFGARNSGLTGHRMDGGSPSMGRAASSSRMPTEVAHLASRKARTASRVGRPTGDGSCSRDTGMTSTRLAVTGVAYGGSRSRMTRALAIRVGPPTGG
jgi:hypothetical protein